LLATPQCCASAGHSATIAAATPRRQATGDSNERLERPDSRPGACLYRGRQSGRRRESDPLAARTGPRQHRCLVAAGPLRAGPQCGP